MQELMNQILCGDCVEILRTAKEPFADLIFADPPFNIGYM
jgi:modification methylase